MIKLFYIIEHDIKAAKINQFDRELTVYCELFFGMILV